MLSYASDCACGPLELAFAEGRPKRLAVYWERLERQLAAYLRERKQARFYDPELPCGDSIQTDSDSTPDDIGLRDDARHNGHKMIRLDRSLDPANCDDPTDLLNVLSDVARESQIVTDHSWQFLPEYHRYNLIDPPLVAVRAPVVTITTVPGLSLSPEMIRRQRNAERLMEANDNFLQALARLNYERIVSACGS